MKTPHLRIVTPLLACLAAESAIAQTVTIEAPGASGSFSAGTTAQGGSGSPNLSLSADAKGKIVVVTDVNGKKETKVIDVDSKGRQPLVIQTDTLDAREIQSPTWLGVATEPLSAELAAQVPVPANTGLLVQQVVANSPAAKAGMQVNDVLAKLNDQILIAPRQLAVLIGNMKEGESVKIAYFRKGQQAEATATLGNRQTADAAASILPLKIKIGGESTDLKPLVSMVKSFITKDGEVADVIRALGGKGEINVAAAFENLPEETRHALEVQYNRMLADPSVPDTTKELVRQVAEGVKTVDLKPLAGLIDTLMAKNSNFDDVLKGLTAKDRVDLDKLFEGLPPETRSAVEAHYDRLLNDPNVPESSKEALRKIAAGGQTADLKPLASIITSFMTKDGKAADVVKYLGKDGGIDFGKAFESLPPETRSALESQYKAMLADPNLPEEAKAALRKIAESIEKKSN